jgi:hypothetical protein
VPGEGRQTFTRQAWNKKAAIPIVAFFLSGCGGDEPAWPDSVLKELCITIDRTNIDVSPLGRKYNFMPRSAMGCIEPPII